MKGQRNWNNKMPDNLPAKTAGKEEASGNNMASEQEKAPSANKKKEPEGQQQKDWAVIRLFLKRLIIFTIAMVLLFGVVFKIKVVNSDDMKPAMRIGDLELVYCLPAKRRPDSVVLYRKDGQEYNGRIVAGPSDTVEIRNEALYVNGSSISSPNIYFSTPAYEGEVTYPLTLGDDEYFVLSDWRQGGLDSRQFGPVRSDEIIGNVMTIVRRSQI